jgi:hypothetical protein
VTSSFSIRRMTVDQGIVFRSQAGSLRLLIFETKLVQKQIVRSAHWWPSFEQNLLLFLVKRNADAGS